MAISFSRPDPSSPSSVGAASFPMARRGYDQGEVRDFLRMVAAELARLQERERFLESEMRAMQTRGLSAPGRLDEETVTTLLGEEAARVLTTARDAASQIRERAEESATRLVKDAAEDAARIREAATLEAQRIRDDSATDANAEIELAKQQGRDMVNEAREYREKVLSELSRRRDAARAQIEQLLHGRDRLMSAFERARIATDSVINELHEAHDEPETLVNLAPTTGPIPIVNPHHPSVTAYDQETAQPEVVARDGAHAGTGTNAGNGTNIDISLESILEPMTDAAVDSPDDSVHSVETIEIVEIADDIAETIDVVEVVDVVDVVDGVDEVVEENIDIVTVDADSDSHAGTDTPSHLDDDDNEPAPTNVVSLFDRRPSVVPDHPVATPAAEKSAATTSAKVDHSVDDIFAKLRAGSVEKVAAGTSTKESAKKDSAATDSGTTDRKKVDQAQAEPKKSELKKADPKKAETPAQRKKIEPVLDPARFAARDEAIAPLVSSVGRKFKRVLADEQNNVLEHLRNKRSSLEIDAILGTVAEHAKRYAAAIAEDSMSAAGAGVKSMKAAKGTSKRVTQKAVDTAVAKAIADGLVAMFREDARIAIGEAEGDRQILASLIRDVYRTWKMSGIDAHVDDVVCAAHNTGAFLSLDPATSIVWIVDPNNECCGDCADNSLAGSVTKGSEFPTGDTHPMAHAGCRCLIAPAAH